MPGLSRDPERRAAQVANLKRGEERAPLGNQRAVKHGAYATIARDRVDAKVREVFDALAQDAPLQTSAGLPAEDGAIVRLAAEVMCRIDDLASFLLARGWMDEHGQPRTTLLELEARLRREAAGYLADLGMTPTSRAKLGLDVARAQTFDLAKHWAEDTDTIDGEAIS